MRQQIVFQKELDQFGVMFNDNFVYCDREIPIFGLSHIPQTEQSIVSFVKVDAILLRAHGTIYIRKFNSSIDADFHLHPSAFKVANHVTFVNGKLEEHRPDHEFGYVDSISCDGKVSVLVGIDRQSGIMRADINAKIPAKFEVFAYKPRIYYDDTEATIYNGKLIDINTDPGIVVQETHTLPSDIIDITPDPLVDVADLSTVELTVENRDAMKTSLVHRFYTLLTGKR